MISREERNQDRFDKFTERARKVLTLAQEEATRFNHTYIGTEHLLLGLVREGDGVAAKVLTNLGVELNRVRSAVEFVIGRGDSMIVGEIGLTPRAKKVVELSVDEGRRLGHHYIGTEHLLLGLVREGEGIATGVLESLGVTLEKVRTQTIQVLSESKTPTIDQLGLDLTARARAGKMDPVIGRATEIERVVQILSCHRKNNPALIREPGVDNAAIVEGLAQRIVAGEVPEMLCDKRVICLDLTALAARCTSSKKFDKWLGTIIVEAQTDDCLLFLPHAHAVFHTDTRGVAVHAGSILEMALKRGEIQCIATITADVFQSCQDVDAALSNYFTQVSVPPLPVEETIKILHGLRQRYEEHHRLRISDEALKVAAEMAERYVTGGYMPDKAIDLMDEAASRVCMHGGQPFSLRKAMVNLEKVRGDKLQARITQQYEEVAALCDREQKLRDKISKLQRQDTEQPSEWVVTESDIAEVVAMWTGIPVMRIRQWESEGLLQMEDALHNRVIGQEEAISVISRAMDCARTGLKDPKRPIGSFIFLGPTGVGKTELAKALAEFMFGSEDALITIDMGEGLERHSLSKHASILAVNAGDKHVGQLTDAVRRRPYSVVLLEEIEQAPPEMSNILLQILEYGKVRDAKGREIDFRNTIIIMTANIGMQLFLSKMQLDFQATIKDEDKTLYDEQASEEMIRNVMDELQVAFRPRLLNRIDATIIFHSLHKDQIRQVVDLMLKGVQNQLIVQEIALEMTDEGKAFLVKQVHGAPSGGHALRRAIQTYVEKPLAEGLLTGFFHAGDTVVATQRGGEWMLEPQPRTESEAGELAATEVDG